MSYFSMKRKAVAVAAAAAFVLVVAQLQTAAFAADQRKFDYIVLAMKYPSSACINIEHCCPENACCQGAKSPTEFTIHGLWPEYEGGGWPECCTDQKFDPNKISFFSKLLLQLWPSYECGSKKSCHNSRTSFWGAQYEKHGTCAAPVLNGELNYFATAIGMSSKYNITKILKDAGVVPSGYKVYPLTNITSSIQLAFSGIPRIICREHGIMNEIWLCFDKNLKPRDCEYVPDKSCPKFVYLPPYEPQEPEDKGAIPGMAEIAEAVM